MLHWGYVYASYTARVIQHLKKKENSFNSILDVGCGDGRLTFELSHTFLEKSVSGMDYSKQSLAFARAFAPQVDFSEKLEGVHDAFTLIEVLEHIHPEEVDVFFADLCQHISRDGFGIITVPHENVPVNPKHYRHFNEELLRKTLSPYFEIECIEYLNAKNMWDALVRRLFSNRFFILNHAGVRNWLFERYIKTCLFAEKRNASRLLVVVRKRG